MPAVAVPMVGAPGTVRGFTDAGDDEFELPLPLVARTVTVYVLPFVKPVIVHGEAAHDCVTVSDPEVAVTV